MSSSSEDSLVKKPEAGAPLSALALKAAAGPLQRLNA